MSTALIVLLGAAVGGFVGFGITLFGCRAIDWINGKSDDGGNNLMSVGWIFCFITVPFGSVLGGCLAWLMLHR